MYQIAEEHQEAIFLKVNFEVHKFLCDALTVRVLPFFHLYRGAQGRICSFSCTLGTVISILVLFFLFVFFFTNLPKSEIAISYYSWQYNKNSL
jgi:hypothetical protein